jgi:hypothetical protein
MNPLAARISSPEVDRAFLDGDDMLGVKQEMGLTVNFVFRTIHHFAMVVASER